MRSNIAQMMLMACRRLDAGQKYTHMKIYDLETTKMTREWCMDTVPMVVMAFRRVVAEQRYVRMKMDHVEVTTMRRAHECGYRADDDDKMRPCMYTPH